MLTTSGISYYSGNSQRQPSFLNRAGKEHLFADENLLIAFSLLFLYLSNYQRYSQHKGCHLIH